LIGRLFFLFILLITSSSAAFSRAGSPDPLEIIPNTGLSDSVSTISFSPDDSWIVSGSRDGSIKLWDRASGRLLRTLSSSDVTAVQVAPDGKSIISQSPTGTVNIWDALTGKLVRSLGDVRPPGVATSGSLIGSLPLSRDGRFIYIGNLSAIRRINVETGAIDRNLRSSAFGAWVDFAVSPNERVIAAISRRIGREYRVSLIDSQDGRLIRTLRTYADQSVNTYIEHITFSADGDLVAVATATRVGSSDDYKGTTQVWDVSSGRSLYTVTHATSNSPFVNISQAEFSPDGRRLVTAGKDGIKFWDARTGKELFHPDDQENLQDNRVLAFSHDGRVIASGTQLTLTVRDAETGTLMPVSFGQREGYSVQLSALDDGRWLSIASSGMTIWDPATWQPSQVLGWKPDQWAPLLQHQAKEKSGRTLVITQNKEALSLNIWDARSGRIVSTVEWGKFRITDKPCATCINYGISHAALSPDGQWAAASLYGDGGVIKVWNVSSGLLTYVLRLTHLEKQKVDAGDGPNELFFSSDSSSIFATEQDASTNTYLSAWALDTGKMVSSARVPSKYGVDLSYLPAPTPSPDGRWIAAGYGLWVKGTTDVISTVALFDTATAKVIKAFNTSTSSIATIIRISRDQQYVFAGGTEGGINQWDVPSGRLVRSFDSNGGMVSSIAFSKDETQLVASYANGTSTVWNIQTGERLLTTLHAKSGEWVSITPEGFFSASSKGAELLHVVRGFEPISIDQVYNALYRPDLVREKLAGDPDGKVKAAAAQLDLDKVMASGVAPKVTITSPATGVASPTDEVAVEASVADQGGGIGKVEWRVNGVTLGLESRGLDRLDASSGGGATSGRTETVKRTLALEPGDNRIEVVAYNAKGLIASQPAEVTIKWDGAKTASPPKLYVLAIGVNDYYDSRLHLAYAVPDATALADAFKKAGTGLYASVEVKTVLDKDVTVDNLDKVFADLSSRVQPRDVFVFFLAGHGKTENGRYYFLPRDFRYEDDSSIQKAGMGQDKFQAWFAGIPARKSLLLYDTCESGSLTGATRGSDIDERLGALNRMARATGRTFLTATTDDAPALEGFHGHGVFTYALLDALDHADVNHDGLIEISELADYVDQKVPDYSYEAFKLRQIPQRSIVGNNFAVTNKTEVMAAAPDGAAGEMSIPTKPTHVVIAPVDVKISASDAAVTVTHLAPGVQVRLLETANGWVLIARDGQKLGYVADKSLLGLQ
jgi:WD40 repeat protein